jgi:putative colanic acid biosysnthesis UDP-glucose lipid carrier transferase
MNIRTSEEWLRDASPISQSDAIGVATAVSPAQTTDAAANLDESPYLDSRLKRVFDLCGAAGILLSLAPLLVMVALLVRLTSPGPAIYRQKRRGAGGQPFTMFKFRSMYMSDDGESYVVQAMRKDHRTTPIGRILRKTSIDELPQLFNVLRNEMSLIGPRPHAISHDEYYSAHIRHYRHRFAARPGLSGLAQVSGARGATPEIEDMARRVRYDLEYVRTASLGTDLRIVAATIREMFFSSSAY